MISLAVSVRGGEEPGVRSVGEVLEAVRELLVPTLSLYEVFKRILQQRDEGQALQAVALMQQARVVELSAPLALAAARLSLERRLPMADSIMLATTRAHGATLWSQDADLKNLPGVRYVATKRAR